MIGSFWPTTTTSMVEINLKGIDKIVHFLFYFILAILLFRSLNKLKNGKIGKKVTIGTIFMIILYGLVIEIAQHQFFPSRHFEILDFIANIIGTLSGYFIFYHFLKKNNS